MERRVAKMVQGGKKDHYEAESGLMTSDNPDELSAIQAFLKRMCDTSETLD